jgi:hypothetical protein
MDQVFKKDIFKTLQVQRKKSANKYFTFGSHQLLRQEVDPVPP